LFRYDYSLIRDEGLEKHEYKPEEIPKKICNLAYIKAPNSSGKSTLLNVIALGLFASNNKKIDPAIKKKLASLSDLKHQVLNAEFTIEDKFGNIELKSKIINGKPNLIKIVNRKEQTITSDRFENEYNLIYDLPTNPTERLKELTTEIEIYQERLGNQILRFSDYLSRVLKEISDSQDPKKIGQLDSQLSQLKKHLKQWNETKESIEEKNEKLKRFFSMKYYIFYKKKIGDTENNIRRLTPDERLIVEKKKKKLFASKKLLDTINLVFAKINKNREELTKNLIFLIPKEENRLRIWKECPDLQFEKIEDYLDNFDDGLNLKATSQDFFNLLEKESENTQYRTSIKEYEIYHDIIKFFEELKTIYKDEEIIIPGVDRSLQDFIEILIEKNRENTKIHQKIELIKGCLKNLNEIVNDIDSLEKFHFTELVKQKEIEVKNIDTPEKIDDVLLKKLKDELKAYNKKFEMYRKSCQDYGFNTLYIEQEYEKLIKTDIFYKIYIDYTENQLIEEINENDERIASLTREISNSTAELKYKETELEKLKQKKQHPFRNDSENITILANKTRLLAQFFLKNYSGYLKDLKDQAPGTLLEDKEKIKYYKELGIYFGKKLQTIIYNGIPEKLEFVDLINEEIHMNNGLKAKFLDFGTGESQATYLKSVLETSRNDKRKLIVLFDEVGMIDDIRLNQVIGSLRNLYEEEKLLLGIIVQKGQNVEIIDLI